MKTARHIELICSRRSSRPSIRNAPTTVYGINAVKRHPDPALPWLLAMIDWEVVGASDVQILVCKIVGIDEA